jgi:hypothetical protein
MKFETRHAPRVWLRKICMGDSRQNAKTDTCECGEIGECVHTRNRA